MEAPQRSPRPISGYFLAAPSNRKIPLILTVVSYSFLLPAVPSFLYLIFLGFLICAGGFPSRGGIFLSMLLSVLLVQIFFWFFLSRGLRHCSRGWRMCALVIIWLGFGSIGIEVIRLLLVKRIPHSQTFLEFGLSAILSCGLLAWQYWVLTRSDIRKLFYPNDS